MSRRFTKADKVREFLRQGWRDVEEISQVCGVSYTYVRDIRSKMIRSGKLKTEGRLAGRNVG